MLVLWLIMFQYSCRYCNLSFAIALYLVFWTNTYVLLCTSPIIGEIIHFLVVYLLTNYSWTHRRGHAFISCHWSRALCLIVPYIYFVLCLSTLQYKVFHIKGFKRQIQISLSRNTFLIRSHKQTANTNKIPMYLSNASLRYTHSGQITIVKCYDHLF